MNRLISLQSYIKQLLDREMDFFTQHLSEPIEEILTYYYSLGGKKLRPALFLTIANAFGSDENLAPHALSLELIHTMSLYHDDVLDGAKERRGAQSVHEKWNKATAIVGGDIFHSIIHGHLIEASRSGRIKNKDLTYKFLEDLIYSVELPIGTAVLEEMRLSESDEIPSLEQSIDISVGKTAPLFAFSAAAGAYIAGQSQEIAEDMYEMGRHLGYAFQLLDDIGDFYKSDKDMGGDLREDKKTPILVLAHRRDAKRIEYYRNKRHDLSDSDVLQFRKEFQKEIQEVLGWVKDNLTSAKKYLKMIPDNSDKQLIKALFSMLEIKILEFSNSSSKVDNGK